MLALNSGSDPALGLGALTLWILLLVGSVIAVGLGVAMARNTAARWRTIGWVERGRALGTISWFVGLGLWGVYAVIRIIEAHR